MADLKLVGNQHNLQELWADVSGGNALLRLFAGAFNNNGKVIGGTNPSAGTGPGGLQWRVRNFGPVTAV